MTEQFSPEAGPQGSGGNQHDLERELRDAGAEAQRSASRLLADTLQNSLTEHQAVIKKALGAAGYQEAMTYIRQSNAVDAAYAGMSETAQLESRLNEQPQGAPDHEMPGAPESLNNLHNVEAWLTEQVTSALEPYDLFRGHLYSYPKRFSDQGMEQISLSRFVPAPDGVVYEITATGTPGNMRQLRKSLLEPDAMSEARELTAGEAFELETALRKYHARMTEIAALTPEQILDSANSPGDGPDVEPA